MSRVLRFFVGSVLASCAWPSLSRGTCSSPFVISVSAISLSSVSLSCCCCFTNATLMQGAAGLARLCSPSLWTLLLNSGDLHSAKDDGNSPLSRTNSVPGRLHVLLQLLVTPSFAADYNRALISYTAQPAGDPSARLRARDPPARHPCKRVRWQAVRRSCLSGLTAIRAMTMRW